MLSQQSVDFKKTDFTTSSTKELLQLLDETKQQKMPIKNIEQLKYIRNLNQCTTEMVEKWNLKINSLENILQYAKKNKLNELYGWSGVIKKTPDPETAYKAACDKYADALCAVIKSHHYPYMAESLKHVQYCSNLTLLRSLMDNDVYVLTNIMQEADILAFYHKYFNNNPQLLELYFKVCDTGSSENRSLLRMIIHALPDEILLKNLTPSIKEHYPEMYYVYETEKGRALKPYTDEELVQLDKFIAKQLSDQVYPKSFNRIYEKHKNHSYMRHECVLLVQQKIYDALSYKAKYENLADAVNACKAAKEFSVFTIDSPIKQELFYLTEMLENISREENNSCKRNSR